MKNSECIEDGSETNDKICKCKKGFLFIKDDCLKEGMPTNKEFIWLVPIVIIIV